MQTNMMILVQSIYAECCSIYELCCLCLMNVTIRVQANYSPLLLFISKHPVQSGILYLRISSYAVEGEKETNTEREIKRQFNRGRKPETSKINKKYSYYIQLMNFPPSNFALISQHACESKTTSF